MADKIINEQSVQYVAKLSRLGLLDSEIGKFTSQLGSVLEYIRQLEELDTSHVEPTSHAVSGVKNVFREDEVKQSLPADEALANAPKRIGDFFGVPKVIE
jgi:aspartyl-tRNA(Asn)/glutamyl-tRNA(Gln) amidotransferase subunit C